MVALRHFAVLLTVGSLLFLPSRQTADAGVPDRSDSLFAQSAAETLANGFNSPDLSYLLVDAESGRMLASRWNHANRPIPMGSLVKPFTALAYAGQYGFAFPSYICRGSATHCWRPQGHGRVDLRQAIAYSCNAYFLMLASQLNARQVSPTAASYGLDSPPANAKSPALAGLGNEWKVSPMHLVHAYVELLHRRDQPGVDEILQGMALSGGIGTGAGVDRELSVSDALVKTGTAPCTHSAHAPGDGFAVALWPSDNPRLLLLVRVHSAPGAIAAKTAGQMLHRIGE